MSYPISIGRNIFELSRSCEAITTCSMFHVYTPCNWKRGEDLFVDPDLSIKSAKYSFK